MPGARLDAVEGGDAAAWREGSFQSVPPWCSPAVLFNTHPSTGAKKRGLRRSLRVTHHTPGSCKQRGQHWMSPSIPGDPGTLQGQATLSRAPCSIPSWILRSWRHCCPQEIQPPERGTREMLKDGIWEAEGMNSICPALLINHTGSSRIISECLKGGNAGRGEFLTGAGNGECQGC